MACHRSAPLPARGTSGALRSRLASFWWRFAALGCVLGRQRPGSPRLYLGRAARAQNAAMRPEEAAARERLGGRPREAGASSGPVPRNRRGTIPDSLRPAWCLRPWGVAGHQRASRGTPRRRGSLGLLGATGVSSSWRPLGRGGPPAGGPKAWPRRFLGAWRLAGPRRLWATPRASRGSPPRCLKASRGFANCPEAPFAPGRL